MAPSIVQFGNNPAPLTELEVNVCIEQPLLDFILIQITNKSSIHLDQNVGLQGKGQTANRGVISQMILNRYILQQAPCYYCCRVPKGNESLGLLSNLQFARAESLARKTSNLPKRILFALRLYCEVFKNTEGSSI